MNEESLPQQSFNLAIGQDKVAGFTLDPAIAVTASGWAMAFYLSSRTGTLLLTKTSADGITYTGDADVQSWDVSIDAADTADLKPQLANWSLWRTDDGSKTPLAVGTCDVYRTSLPA